MSSQHLSRVQLQRELERITQEREVFDQHKAHENLWFMLRLGIGWCSVLLLPSVMAVSSYVLLRSPLYPDAVVTAAAAALFVDVLGVVAAVWKIALAPESITALEPVTKVSGSALPATPGSPGAGPHPPETVADRKAGISYRVRVEGTWLPWVSEGKIAGTTGRARRVEALEAQLTDAPPELSIRYQAHVENYGWMGWVTDGETAGTTGQGLRLEAVRAVLDNAAPGYHVKYQAHVEQEGWMDWRSDGEVAGTTGQSKRLEAIRILVTAPESSLGGQA
jgi:hypothetical protein